MIGLVMGCEKVPSWDQEALFPLGFITLLQAQFLVDPVFHPHCHLHLFPHFLPSNILLRNLRLSKWKMAES
jgi:hypothetical protein